MVESTDARWIMKLCVRLTTNEQSQHEFTFGVYLGKFNISEAKKNRTREYYLEQFLYYDNLSYLIKQ